MPGLGEVPTATIDGASLRPLASNFAGVLIQPHNAGVDAARQIWNGQVQRRQALIARCRGTADVIVVVRYRREHGLPASVRGGGHAGAGHAICDCGVRAVEANGGGDEPLGRRSFKALHRVPGFARSGRWANRWTSCDRRLEGAQATTAQNAEPLGLEVRAARHVLVGAVQSGLEEVERRPQRRHPGLQRAVVAAQHVLAGGRVARGEERPDVW
jgi:hypothetical protein